MRVVLSIESGPHPGIAELAQDIARAMPSALVVHPPTAAATAAELDRGACTSSRLALAISRIQANCAAIARCPPPAVAHANDGVQIVVCTDGFFPDALFVDDAVDTVTLAQLHATYGRRAAIDLHVCVVLDLSVAEMHEHAVRSAMWPQCSVSDLEDLPLRFATVARKYPVTADTRVVVVTPSPHFEDCDVDRTATVRAVLHRIK